ncbi:3-keto-5-aminohexanoate cleavage protein [Nostoc sp. FACHB-152]|uniref:3-keto-5-aminohexanoate cleavage protein n=1 Tax=unclassified Nostoc TaxID=2593658 RepID=UPI00168728A2|nr:MULTISPECIES: 3-keto-5-aminohexanoate cleavage protein [unclassified Nostoc]MBD2450332.1 3-keto-5-aminohexanoate cleavage protein [Nostoc sp. FACHB-152]MBD2471764.1 3-keto-5-aminohexanoate cleavage protein [Nostoc sp. FACHB-145]
MNEQLPLIIECRCNEIADRTANPNVPYSPKEIIQEAVRAWEAGASIFHWHGRDPESGKPRNDVELYLEVIEGIRAQTDLLIHPTLGYITQNRVEDRVRHILAVNDDPVLRVDMAPVDFGSLNVDFWNPQAKQFTTYNQVYVNTRENLRAVLEVFKKHNVYVSSVCWDVGQMRTARCFQEMGLLPQETLWEFVFTGEVMPSGAAATIHGLQAFVAEVPAGNQWLALCWNGDVMKVAAWAITLGGHVGIGLGDYAYTRFGKPHNGELVEMVAKMAHTVGREVATPAQAREILKMSPRTSRKEDYATANS